jgi:hypothetical protein
VHRPTAYPYRLWPSDRRVTAVSPDFTRVSLGVPGMNYSVLLPRSVDFAPFAEILYPSYPNETARPLIFDLMQDRRRSWRPLESLWPRAPGVGARGL